MLLSAKLHQSAVRFLQWSALHKESCCYLSLCWCQNNRVCHTGQQNKFQKVLKKMIWKSVHYIFLLCELSWFSDITSTLHCHAIRVYFLWFSTSCLVMWSWTLALNTTAASWHGITRSLCRGHRAQVANTIPVYNGSHQLHTASVGRHAK